jgi:hypothetical protein
MNAAGSNPVAKFLSQVWGSIFRHGLPTTDKVAARTALTNFFLHIHPVRVKKSAIRVSYTLCLGGLSFFLFILLTISGLFLMFYYIPSVDQAYQNIKDLEFVATFGLVIRNLHRWAAHGMVITVWLHMARVFYQGAYKPPREFNWAIGTSSPCGPSPWAPTWPSTRPSPGRTRATSCSVVALSARARSYASTSYTSSPYP